MGQLETKLIDFINSDEMTREVHQYFTSIKNESDQLVFFCEVKALRLWAVFYCSTSLVKNRDELVKLLDAVEQNFEETMHPEVVNFIYNRSTTYNQLGTNSTVYGKVAALFVQNTKLGTNYNNHAIEMAQAFLGRANNIFKESR